MTLLPNDSGLSQRFIYSNDDFFLMQPICPDDFITEKDELILYPKEQKHKTIYGEKDWPTIISRKAGNEPKVKFCKPK